VLFFQHEEYETEFFDAVDFEEAVVGDDRLDQIRQLHAFSLAAL
jgi:hypothetical protein